MYYLYILLCCDTTLYTGITTNLEKRFNQHILGLGSKYVRSRLPFLCIYTEEHSTKPLALKRELEIKSWSHKKKMKILKLDTFPLVSSTSISV